MRVMHCSWSVSRVIQYMHVILTVFPKPISSAIIHPLALGSIKPVVQRYKNCAIHMSQRHNRE